MFNPVPSYLIAIVAGNIVDKKLGDRSSVIAEPDVIDLSALELEDLEQYLNTIESYI